MIKSKKMKTKILSLVLFAMIIFSTTFAGNTNPKIVQSVLTAFKQEFVNAQEVSWQKINDYYKATFQLNGQYQFAFFTREGEIMGVARNLSSTELPILLKSSLYDHTSFWISELFKYTTGGETTYYATLENSDHQVTFQSTGSTSWAVYKITEK
jgi:mRNA deadenylase 3'-5' endonuclease subunit Ccr4